MGHSQARKMTVEEAKLFLLTPPPAPPGRSRLGVNPLLLAGVALGAGLLLSGPGKVRRLARSSSRLLTSPMVRQAVVTFATAMAAKKAAE
jgi:hypothetical protein